MSPQIIDAELFEEVVARERGRSDRSNQPFVLLLLGVPEGSGDGVAAIPPAAIDALAATKREGDVAGWLQWRTLIGVIFTEIPESDLANVCDRIEVRLRRELAKRMESRAMEALLIGLHVYPEPRRPGEGERWPLDPLFYPDLWPLRSPGRRYDAIKRGLDIVGSLTLLIILAPLCLVIAALVKWGSPGPVLFKQVRIGWMMKPFTMLKYRTMTSNADPKVHQDYVDGFIKAGGQSGSNGSNGSNGFFKLTRDPRITPIGRLLRKTSLDEVPQLWNVLRGEMSLVGPRPPIPYEVDRYNSWHRCRVLDAKPGMTGLWQVTGRSRTTFDEMVRLDIRYARQRSLWTDLKILIATPAVVLSGKGAS